MILITGAAGKTGQAVIRELVRQGLNVRALVHRPEQIRSVEELGASEVQVGNMHDQASMDQAARGVKAIYHIPPNVSPDEIVIGETLISSAQAAEIDCFVYHSVLHPQTETMPHHWKKLRVEEALFKSGLPFTILQPAVYMQNILANWEQISSQGIYTVPYAAETRLSMVDLQDVAQVAALVLTETGHAGATYELVGTPPISQTEVAAVLASQIGHNIQVKTIMHEIWEEGARTSGLGAYQIDALLEMFRYYEAYGFSGSPQVLSWLLQRPPTDLAAFIERSKQSLLKEAVNIG